LSTRQIGKMDVTLVSYYGEKPSAIAKLIDGVIDALHGELGNAFRAYSQNQVHGTIIGLEGSRLGNRIINKSGRKT
jgi:hypothetical protein